MQGLNRWWESAPADFEKRVPLAIALYRSQIVKQNEFRATCTWVQCDDKKCRKWRRCQAEYQDTLKEEVWKCYLAEKECGEDYPEDELEEGETWDGQTS